MLGRLLSAEGGAGEASRVRLKCAWTTFIELSTILIAILRGSNGAALTLKGKIHSTCSTSIIIYESEK